MECSNCGHGMEVSKNLQPGQESKPDSCPECGHDLSKSGDGNSLIIK